MGSSRKVVGFKPSNREGEKANEGEEILIVPIAIANSLGDLDFVVEAFQLAGADRENSVGGKSNQTRSFQFSELHEGRDATCFGRVEPTLPALIGGERIPKLEERTKLLFHCIADRKV